MATPIHSEIKHHIRRDSRFSVVYLAATILSLHWALIAYINSTYLSQFISYEAIGALFVIGSALTVFAFLFISRVLRELGNYHLTVGLAIVEMLVLIGMGISDSYRISIPLFVIHQAVVPLMLFNLDVFIESFTGSNEGNTGGRRGILLTIIGLAYAFAPLVTGLLVGGNTPHFGMAYGAAALLLLPFLFIITHYFKSFQDPFYKEVEVLSVIRTFWIKTDLRYVFLAHFLLQLFFAWTMIFIPLYLATIIGLSWPQIGLVLFVGLLAYVLFEFPIGEVADRYFGEKEMMGIGFIILATSTTWISFVASAALLPWMVTMFLTRTGASFVEATTESYFFKHTRGTDADVISFFRITRPLAMVFGALLGSFALLYLPFAMIFVVLGIVLVPGLGFSMMLNDTR